MKEFKEITLVKKEVAKVICNGCGKELDRHVDYLSVCKSWGYGTDYDGKVHSFDLCDECYKKIIDKFVIPPTDEQ